MRAKKKSSIHSNPFFIDVEIIFFIFNFCSFLFAQNILNSFCIFFLFFVCCCVVKLKFLFSLLPQKNCRSSITLLFLTEQKSVSLSGLSFFPNSILFFFLWTDIIVQQYTLPTNIISSIVSCICSSGIIAICIAIVVVVSASVWDNKHSAEKV